MQEYNIFRTFANIFQKNQQKNDKGKGSISVQRRFGHIVLC